MLLLVQFVCATALVAASSAIVLLWLVSLVLSYSGESGLLPWVAAGVILYGFAFVGFAALLGVPGILWARHLVGIASPKWRQVARAPGWIGTAILLCGSAAAVMVLVAEQFRPKDPNDGCVSWRDPAASAAIAAGAESGKDCPALK